MIKKSVIRTQCTEKELAAACNMAEEMGVLRDSITKGRGNIAGFIGEVVAARVIGAKVSNTFDYDLVKDFVTIDVKTKRTTRNFVNPNFEASVADYNTKQKCSLYLFARVNPISRVVHLMGWMSKKDYFKKARFLAKDDMDGSNRFRVQADCWNLKYSEMNPMWVLKASLRRVPKPVAMIRGVKVW